jgi:hypothetical protein
LATFPRRASVPSVIKLAIWAMMGEMLFIGPICGHSPFELFSVYAFWKGHPMSKTYD